VSAPNDDALLRRLIHIPRLSGEAPVFSISDAPYGCPNTTDMPSPFDDVLNLMQELVNVPLPVDLRLTSNFVPDHLTFRSDSGHAKVRK